MSLTPSKGQDTLFTSCGAREGSVTSSRARVTSTYKVRATWHQILLQLWTSESSGASSRAQLRPAPELELLQLPHLTSSRAAAISITGSRTKSVNNAELESVSGPEPILEAGQAPSPETVRAPAPDQVQLLGQWHSQSWWYL